MKTIITFLLVTSLIGCGMDNQFSEPITKKQGGAETQKSDAYLEQYVKHFYGLCLQTTSANRCKENLPKLKTVNFVDSFDSNVDPSGSVAGICWWARSSRRLEIKRNLIKPGTMTERALIFHELGHCLLDLGHSDPKTMMLMNPYLFDEKTYVSNWNTLQNELFQLVLSFLLVEQTNLNEDKETPIF